MIEFVCPNCKYEIRLNDDLAGSLGRCPQCKFELQVPSHDIEGIRLPQMPESEQQPQGFDLETVEINPDKPRPRPVIVNEASSSDVVVDEDRITLGQQWVGILIGFLLGFAVAVTAAGILYGMRDAEVERAAVPQHDAFRAYLASQRYVLEQTSVTEVVSFPWRGFHSRYVGSGQYIVRADFVVRDFKAETSYKEFSCMMAYLSNGNWQCTDLIIAPKNFGEGSGESES